jgi:hypothetical protein
MIDWDLFHLTRPLIMGSLVLIVFGCVVAILKILLFFRKIGAFKKVGQNIYLQKISRVVKGFPIEKSVQKWFNEDNAFKVSQIEPFAFTPETGHFTQLAWAETNEVSFCLRPKRASDIGMTIFPSLPPSPPSNNL